MKNDIEKVLISEEEIQNKVKELGSQLTEEYKDRFPLAIGVLKGAIPFMADLLKRIDTHLEMDFMDVSSYGNSTVSSGEVKIIKDLNTSVEGRDILIIEDIIDSGLTLSYFVELFRYRKANQSKLLHYLINQLEVKQIFKQIMLVLLSRMHLWLGMVWIMQRNTAIYRILGF